MMKSLGISEKDLQKSVSILSALLSDEMVLYIKTRNFHWNVSGESFMEHHKLFEAQYTQLEETIDQVAERISKLGSKTPGSMKAFIQLSCLKESTEKNLLNKQMIKQLLDDHGALIVQLRKYIDELGHNNKDAGTTDMLTSVLQLHETTAWTLRRYTA
jgi:starvation-inducible DNA-binding protein